MPRPRLAHDPSPNSRLVALGIVVVLIVGVSAMLARYDGRTPPAGLPAITSLAPVGAEMSTASAARPEPANTVTRPTPITPREFFDAVPPVSRGAVERQASFPPAPAPATATTTATTITRPTTTTTTTTTTTNSETAQAPVVAIQTVPVVRDLMIEVDGELRATDSSGVLSLGRDEFGSTITVIGVTAEPALTTVEFLRWSDGSTDATRSLADAPGPVIQLGVRINHRVIVELEGDPDRLDAVRFDSPQVGAIEIEVGVPTRVLAARAVSVDGALIPESVTYHVVSGADGEMQRFLPRPESVWTVGR